MKFWIFILAFLLVQDANARGSYTRPYSESELKVYMVIIAIVFIFSLIKHTKMTVYVLITFTLTILMLAIVIYIPDNINILLAFIALPIMWSWINKFIDFAFKEE